MGERLTMSAKERRRVEVMSRVRDGHLTVAAAAAALGVSERQAWRLRRRYADGGDAALVHRPRGRASNNKADDAARAAVLARYRERYAGFGPTLACEYLAKDGHAVGHDALGRWLRAEGLFEPRRGRGTRRLRRPRRGRAGELVQMDGSWHDWLGGRGAAWCCLMVLVDDATGRAFARFYDRETLAAAFDVFGRYARLRGLPRARRTWTRPGSTGRTTPTARRRSSGGRWPSWASSWSWRTARRRRGGSSG